MQVFFKTRNGTILPYKAPTLQCSAVVFPDWLLGASSWAKIPTQFPCNNNKNDNNNNNNNDNNNKSNNNNNSNNNSSNNNNNNNNNNKELSFKFLI